MTYPVMSNNEFIMHVKQLVGEATTTTLSPAKGGANSATGTIDYSTGNPFTNPVYVEWYWVVLGLIIPIVLGSLFCILDHLRRKKRRNTRQTEQRLESMCERNKYVPPKYEEIIPNNQIVIQPVPDLELPLPTATNEGSQPIFTIDTEMPAVHTLPDYKPVKSPQLLQEPVKESDNHSINSSTILTADNSYPPTTDASDHMDVPSDHAEVASDHVDVAVIVEPPSYDEYHKYELYGSREELV